MSKITHTPGPWFVTRQYVVGPKDESDSQGFGMVIGVADVYGDNRNQDAHLIAAAPDLLAVAKECIDLAKLAESLCGCRGDDDYVWGIQERLNAAIAKAEGRS